MSHKNRGLVSAEEETKERIARKGGEAPHEEQNISAEFPFESNYVEVLGSKMHYIDEGEGDPILFLHGNPTSSYLWRNIIPYVVPYGRAIAVDLIGMGKSDKPDIGYRFVDHAKYLEAFIEKLDLKNITLVIHDWGSALGFNYAMLHADNVDGIAFMEGLLRPLTYDEFPNDDVKKIVQTYRTPEAGYDLIVNKNFFIEQLLPSMTLRKLTEEEMNQYREPYKIVESRKPVWVFPNEIPIDGKPADVTKIVTDYNQWLQETELPKILFYANPGFSIQTPLVEWCKANLKNLETFDVGQGIHFLQEDHPEAIGNALANWIQQLKFKSQ
jgi:haloalkane dehalogenase